MVLPPLGTPPWLGYFEKTPRDSRSEAVRCSWGKGWPATIVRNLLEFMDLTTTRGYFMGIQWPCCFFLIIFFVDRRRIQIISFAQLAESTGPQRVIEWGDDDDADDDDFIVYYIVYIIGFNYVYEYIYVYIYMHIQPVTSQNGFLFLNRHTHN